MSDYLYHYYVEGENEEKIVNALKAELRCIKPGKVTVFDVVKRKLTKERLMRLKKGTIVVLVFDTDTDSADILKMNLEFLSKQSFIKKTICVTQVENLEDELERSCKIKSVKELTGSRTIADYKRKLNVEKNLGSKLVKYSFDINKFWVKEAEGPFSDVKNNSNKIKTNKT